MLSNGAVGMFSGVVGNGISNLACSLVWWNVGFVGEHHIHCCLLKGVGSL